jgi:hypothetical protein
LLQGNQAHLSITGDYTWWLPGLLDASHSRTAVVYGINDLTTAGIQYKVQSFPITLTNQNGTAIGEAVIKSSKVILPGT